MKKLCLVIVAVFVSFIDLRADDKDNKKIDDLRIQCYYKDITQNKTMNRVDRYIAPIKNNGTITSYIINESIDSYDNVVVSEGSYEYKFIIKRPDWKRCDNNYRDAEEFFFGYIYDVLVTSVSKRDSSITKKEPFCISAIDLESYNDCGTDSLLKDALLAVYEGIKPSAKSDRIRKCHERFDKKLKNNTMNFANFYCFMYDVKDEKIISSTLKDIYKNITTYKKLRVDK